MELIQHFGEHGNEFGAATDTEYEALADAFWHDPKPAHVQECRRRRGDILRFDPITQTLSAVDNKSVIRTFFKPIPCVSVTVPQRAAMKAAGRCHDYTDNLLYFQARCRQW
jgi:pyocin large subunit-like protein